LSVFPNDATYEEEGVYARASCSKQPIVPKTLIFTPAESTSFFFLILMSCPNMYFTMFDLHTLNLISFSH
jgi:hypothetical protein